MKPEIITLTKTGMQSGSNRVQWAEALILQMPADHDGRNSWLLNYGVGKEAVHKRALRGLAWVRETQAAETTS